MSTNVKTTPWERVVCLSDVGVSLAAPQTLLIAEGSHPEEVIHELNDLYPNNQEATRLGLLALRDAIDRLLSVGAEQHKEERP